MSADFARILKLLHAEGVRFVVIGGMAAIEHGGSQFTDDLDICYDRSDGNLERLAKVSDALGARLRGAPEGLPFRPDAPTLKAGLNFTFTTESGDLDVLGEVGGIGFYERVNAGAVDATVSGVPIRVISLEDLIAAKKHAGRPKDRNHLLELEELLKEKRGR